MAAWAISKGKVFTFNIKGNFGWKDRFSKIGIDEMRSGLISGVGKY